MHNMQPSKGAKKSVKRLGRGNATGKGTTAGRGQKGQRARSGGRSGLKLLGMRQLMLSTPKLRGFKSLNRPIGEVSLSDLNKAYSDGDTVSLQSLRKLGLISQETRKAKVLANGTLGKRLTIKGVAVSEKAKEKIAAAGGSVS